jgi:hypothetical protein
MKIEMGESLLYSWLRHVEGCQVAQLNWKTATIDNARLHAVEKVYNLFKEKLQLNSTLSQFLRQAEIDVLGIKTKTGGYDIYAIDIAFHEGGLGYSDSTDRVIKKMLRSALVVYNQFDVKTGRLIFACPRINNPSIIDAIKDGLSEITARFKEFGFNFSFEIIYNQNFQTQILNKVLLKSKEIKDTSELFVRSLKMLGIFNEEIGSINLHDAIDESEPEPIESIPDVDAPFQNIEDVKLATYSELLNSNLKIGLKAQYFFDKLVEDKKLIQFFNKNPDLRIQNFPILKEVTNKSSEEIRNSKDKVRYYSTHLIEDNRSFLLCSQWYDKYLPSLIKAAEGLNLN